MKRYFVPLGITTLFWWFLFSIGIPFFGGLASPPASMGVNKFYYLVKGGILWVPLGFVFALAGRSETLKRWILSGVFSFMVVTIFSGASVNFLDYVEIAFAPIGSWTGLWIGRLMTKV